MKQPMNHYQKTAVLLVRCAATGAAGIGLLGVAYGTALQARGMVFRGDQLERLYAGYWYALVGIVLFLLAGPIGRLLGRGLE